MYSEISNDLVQQRGSRIVYTIFYILLYKVDIHDFYETTVSKSTAFRALVDSLITISESDTRQTVAKDTCLSTVMSKISGSRWWPGRVITGCSSIMRLRHSIIGLALFFDLFQALLTSLS